MLGCRCHTRSRQKAGAICRLGALGYSHGTGLYKRLWVRSSREFGCVVRNGPRLCENPTDAMIPFLNRGGMMKGFVQGVDRQRSEERRVGKEGRSRWSP